MRIISNRKETELECALVDGRALWRHPYESDAQCKFGKTNILLSCLKNQNSLRLSMNCK